MRGVKILRFSRARAAIAITASPQKTAPDGVVTAKNPTACSPAPER